MPEVVIAVENLRIGGYQRLALDQAYCLSDLNVPVKLLLLNPQIVDLKSFESSEDELFLSKKLQVERLSGRRLKDFFVIRRMLKNSKTETLIISHSMRSTVIFFLARIRIRKTVVINTTIHQLPSLSAFVQRQKRFLYSQFSDNLFAYSEAVLRDWRARYPIGVEIKLLRNGIYLERLPLPNLLGNINPALKPRLIFLGRNTSWKGIETYFELLKHEAFIKYDGLMMLASSSPDILERARRFNVGRVDIIEGANLQYFEARDGDIHIYPAQYGPKAQYVEPISLNCLEMAALGVPTLVSQSLEDTWPELTALGIFTPVNWLNLELSGLSVLFEKHRITSYEIDFIRKTISIESNIQEHLNHLIRALSA